MAGNLYLMAYNLALVLGWGYCLYLTIDTMILKHGSTADLWKVVELPLKVSQTAAVLEVLHSAIGLVRSPVGITGMQVASRLWVLWGIVNLVPEATTRGAVSLGGPSLQLQLGGLSLPLQLNLATLLAAWSITEVVRYSFFAVKEMLRTVPYPLLWLRYSTFIPLYPIGVASELSMAYLALPTIRKQHMWSLDMPNAYNFGFDYTIACYIIIATYLPGLPQLYFYMLSQRKKVLQGAAGGAGAGAESKKSR
ncbi:hypothetical protein Agub_g1942 [Astrephomene gubernaculifera]|uniref:Very-long-chain (3R)-3-hydroxyacyl-CoA dehydratase n=1 Tax=Astrephomene gubernaculifera TaxID=47775 RepID=A0AAD3DID7_9CHLO|nr:hypothetical protein Agub_g1942 [Astrephomene gubernaculifera]